VTGLKSTDHETGPATFDEVYKASRTRVVRTAFLIVGSQAIAEEISQEAFVRLLQHFDDVANPGGFLRTTVVRLCLSWRRHAAVEAAELETRQSRESTGDAEIDFVWDALATLKPDRRAAVVLRYYEDLSHAEIAELMGCRIGTARTRVHRGLIDLRKELTR
jgi:RNA polymerase sigma factor (sigma-70 family)